MRQSMEAEPMTQSNHNDIDVSLAQILTEVVEEVRLSINRDINGADLLYSLLSAPWLYSLLRVYECLVQYSQDVPIPHLPYSSRLSQEILFSVQRLATPSPHAQELEVLLRNPHMQALLSAHDSVAQRDYGPVLPPLPDEMPADEEVMRIVCLVKNKQHLGATIKKDEKTGNILIARVIHGGLADRSGLLHPGDKLMEVNGCPVHGLEPEQVIQILVHSQGNIIFKVIPNSPQPTNSQATLYVRAMMDYSPQQDPSTPCPDAGMAFSKGDLLEIVDQRDIRWWQARKLHSAPSYAGLVPSNNHFRHKQRELWWSQPYQAHTCIRPLSAADVGEDEETDDNRCTDDDAFESGPSGVGVNELRRRLIKINPNTFQGPISHTTRLPNRGEMNGREYHFVTKEVFAHMVINHKFLEYGEHTGHMYGTSIDSVKDVLDSGKICVIDLEPHCIHSVRTKKLKPYIIFVKPPSPECMKQTRKDPNFVVYSYIKRSFTDKDFEEIEEASKVMEAKYSQFFDCVIVNNDLQDSCMDLFTAIQHAQEEPQWIPASWVTSDEL